MTTSSAYVLLCAMSLEDAQIESREAATEALDEFACQPLWLDATRFLACASTIEALESMAIQTGYNGTIVRINPVAFV